MFSGEIIQSILLNKELKERPVAKEQSFEEILNASQNTEDTPEKTASYENNDLTEEKLVKMAKMNVFCFILNQHNKDIKYE